MNVEVGRAWREHRRHVLDVAFRMLGSLSEAEDAVQEAYARLVRADVDHIDDVGGWLVVVVSRICLDRMRSDRRHPTTPDDEVAEAAAAPSDPADRVTLEDSVRLALHLVLERLTPAERTAFVLHDVFQYPFDEIGDIVGRSPAACRQLASRARRAVAADVGRARFRVETAEQRAVTERFIAACDGGDLDALLAVLDTSVAGVADVGGMIGTIVRSGREVVAPLLLLYLGPGDTTTLLSLPAGDRGRVLAVRRGRLVAVVTLTVEDGRVHHLDALVDPAKLAPIGAALGL